MWKRVSIVLAVLLDELFQFGDAFRGGDAAQEGEHDGLIDVEEGECLADVALHEDVHLRAYQLVDDGKVDILAEIALPHAFAEEVDGVFRRAVVAPFQVFVGARIFLDVLEELLVGVVEAFDAALVPFQQHLQHVVRLVQQLFQVKLFLFHLPPDALYQQAFLVGEDFVERAFGDAERGGDVVHRDALDAVFGKQAAGRRDDFLSEFPARGRMFGLFVHGVTLLDEYCAKIGKKT